MMTDRPLVTVCYSLIAKTFHSDSGNLRNATRDLA